MNEKLEEKIVKIENKINDKVEKILAKEDISFEEYSILSKELEKLNYLKLEELNKENNEKNQAQIKEVYETLIKTFMNN